MYCIKFDPNKNRKETSVKACMKCVIDPIYFKPKLTVDK